MPASSIVGGALMVASSLLWASSFFPLSPAAPPGPSCFGSPATITGTGASDLLIGTPGNDVIFAGAGDDTIHGGGGNDLICAGPGDDSADGGAGDDLLLGEEGDDRLEGGGGADTLNGGAGANHLLGGGGDDLLLGGPDSDLLQGGPGADRLYGQGGPDRLQGRGGDDLLAGGDADDVLHGGPGADALHGNRGTDEQHGGPGPDRLYGEDGDDLLWGGDGDDVLRGNDGVDACHGGAGRDDAATCEQVAATETGQVPLPLFRPGPGQVALTFDDGPSAVYTPQILDILDRYDVPATFFVVGLSAADHPGLLARMTAEGHSVQNHTWSHAWLTRYSDAAIADQLARATGVIDDLTGEAPHCFRPPFMAVNDRVRSVAGSLGLTTIMWDVDPWDWKHPGSTAVASRVLAATGGGDIVLFHDTAGWSTIGALPTIIETLRARGLEFVSICSDPGPITWASSDGDSSAFRPE